MVHGEAGHVLQHEDRHALRAGKFHGIEGHASDVIQLHDRAQVWALLAGTNVAPILVITGSLSGLLWRDTARRFGVHVSAREYSAVGVRVGLVALLLAAATVILLG